MRAPSVRILDTGCNLKGEIDNYESLQFTHRFYRAGEFEMHIQIGKQHTDQLLKDRIIMIGKQPHKAGIIRYRQVTEDDKGIETLIVKGPTLGGILDQRVTLTTNYDRIKGPAEKVIKHYVNNHLVNGTYATGIYAARQVPFLTVAADLGRGKETPWQTRFEQLDAVIQEIAEFCDIGWHVVLDIQRKKWVFDVLPGRDLTTKQRVHPPVIFSHDFDNVQSQDYVDDWLQYKNIGYAGGKGMDEDRLIQMVGTGTGFDRRETFLDCSSAKDADELVSMGGQALAQHKRIQTFNGLILSTGSFVYGKDWDLGDRVTLQNKRWGLTMDSRIIEVKEIYEPASKLEIALGDEIPTITQYVKQLKANVKRSD
ncbi:siphovirus ReqiPepy6 Gp37-like family protein [Paenibacillus azoreducens]|uniref:siphovirus ReqiPepy6 Gp37-like family protein n=1 Tax=Paenibacillus azoreducens TaxID=116718 RepID=UPI0039F4E2D8